VNTDLEKAKQYFEAGLTLIKQKDFISAEENFSKALIFLPDRLSILINLSATLVQLEKWSEGEQICQKILALESNNCDALLNLSICLLHKNEQAKAIECLEIVIANDLYLDSAWANKGIIFYELNDLIQAEKCFENALSINPSSEEALVGRGNLRNEKKEYLPALEDFNAALHLNPANSQAKWNKALSLLRLGNYEDGWKLYESRWEISGMREHKLHINSPLWLGDESLKNKVILIHAEQGYGDTIQFSRYIPLLEGLGAKVTLAAQKPLVDLMKTISPSVKVISFEDVGQKAILDTIDYYCPIMSLAMAFDTTLKTIPKKTPYLFSTPEKNLVWHNRITRSQSLKTQEEKLFRVGITWSGSGHYAGRSNLKRNISEQEMATFINSFSGQKIEFHSLQIEKDKNESLLSLISSNLKTHDQSIQNFSDIAALIMEMDLIMSVDTANAHLAGALNKPTLLFIPDPPDFMALTDTNKSHWYPETTILRQKNRGKWDEPLSSAAAIVNELMNPQDISK